MIKNNALLLAVFIAQLLLTLVLFSEDDTSVYRSSENLIDIKIDAIDAITITTVDKQELTLRKKGGQWQLPGYFNIAINTDKFTQVTGNLLAIKTNWPVARTGESAPRFKVAKDKFKTRITFAQQGQIVDTLFLGTAPDFRKVYIRKAGHPEIYSIKFNTYELSTIGKDWMSKDLLKVDASKLVTVKSNNLVLLRKADNWILDKLADNQLTLQEPAHALINKLSNLNYTEIIGDGEIGEYQFNNPDLVVELTNKAGKTWKLVFAKNKNSDYIVKSSMFSHYFKVSQYELQAILESTLAQLITEKTTTSP